MHRQSFVLLLGLALLSQAGLVACARLNHPAPKNAHAVYGALPASASLPPDAEPRSRPARDLRVVTYNVHMQPAADIAAAIRNNIELARADVVLFQEIEDHRREGTSRAAAIADELAMSFAYAPGYALRSGGSHGVAILSRYQLYDIEVIELPYFGVVVNSARRVALAATIELDGKELRIYSVHLDNRINPAQRKRQLAPVLAAADDFVGPAIIAGDLNTSPFCWLGSLLPIPCGMQDNAVETSARKHGFQVPLADSGATAKWLAMRLDAIYVRGLAPRARAVERRVRLSDHLPVWLDLRI